MEGGRPLRAARIALEEQGKWRAMREARRALAKQPAL